MQTDLIQKDSGCSAMLRDNKTEDLKRMFELFSACGAKQIEPIAEIFRKHIESEGMSLVKQATDAVNGSGEGSSSGSGGSGANRKETQAAEQQFIRKVIELQVCSWWLQSACMTCFCGQSGTERTSACILVSVRIM